MANVADDHGEADLLANQDQAAVRADELARKTKELDAFRDAGVLTQSELEEQKAKLRWGTP
ncbi:MAG: hypothetical protein ACRDKV_00095 [Solirubrobacterales bacterium]